MRIPVLMEYRKLVRSPIFGNPNHPIDLEFPKMEDLYQFPLDKRIQLQSVLWKNDNVLMGIQLQFSNGVQTPFFQTDAMAQKPETGSLAIKSQNIDTSRPIRKIKCRLYAKKLLCAMQFLDKNDKIISHFEWDEDAISSWTSYVIPDHYEIIGLYMSKKSVEDPKKRTIEALGFILWKPPIAG